MWRSMKLFHKFVLKFVSTQLGDLFYSHMTRGPGLAPLSVALPAAGSSRSWRMLSGLSIDRGPETQREPPASVS